MSETRWLGQGIVDVDGYTFLYSGRPLGDEKLEGVGIMLGGNCKRAWENGGEQWKAVNSHIIKVRIPVKMKTPKLRRKSRLGFITVFSVYAPTYRSSEEIKEIFYESLEQELQTTPKDDILLVVGDFNSRVGNKVDLWKPVIGPFGPEAQNENGSRLLQFCAVNELCITNTLFKHKDVHTTTWQHPRTKKWSLIDFVITRQRDRGMIHDTRVLRSANVGQTIN